ncbi:PVR cell adhesion molecule related 2 like isoform X1 [Engraulis encrasicolus]|uniref:PVR cell adhesion molecule related 2 like isoform X1 n=1 Tax=Engraulis encrasicolus TaxID=184585 RepID=UPI002FCEAEC1
MAKDGASDSYFTARSWGITVVLLMVLQVSSGQHVKVQPELQAFQKEKILMRCMYTQPGNTKLTQVSWIYEDNDGGERVNIAVFHPTYGESFPDSPFKGRVHFTQGSLENPSIEISDMRMADEGKYTCEYATYPSGNEQGTTNLVMLAKPTNKAEAVTVRAGSASALVARCEAARGKPAATITWESDVPGGKDNTTTLPQPDGTVTVLSEYWMTPTASVNDRSVRCKVAQRTQDHPETFPLVLSIQYPPAVSIEGYDDNWYKGRTDAVLTCHADANPQPTAVDWTSSNGPLPDTVQVEDSGHRLVVKRVDDSVNTTFVCEVKNSLGSGKSQLTAVVIEVSEEPSNTGVLAGAILGGLLAFLLVVSLVTVLVIRSRRQQQQQRSYPGDPETSSYGNKVRLFGIGGSGNGSAKPNKNGGGNNNNGPAYSYREGEPGALDEKPNDPRYQNNGPGSGYGDGSPTPHHILLNERDEAERRKLQAMDDSQEEYEEEEDEVEDMEEDMVDGGGGGGYGGGYHQAPQHHTIMPPLHHAHHHGQQHQDSQMSGYLDDDMESQRDGSVISRTAIYV